MYGGRFMLIYGCFRGVIIAIIIVDVSVPNQTEYAAMLFWEKDIFFTTLCINSKRFTGIPAI